MDKDRQIEDFPQRDRRFLSVLAEVAQVKDEFVVQQLHWYETHAMMPMLLFRISGVLVILFSVSLPLLTTLNGFWRIIVLPVVSLLIASLTGFNDFFRWESVWKDYRQTHMTLEYLLKKWDLQITEARSQLDVQKGIEIALLATEQLLEAARTATSAEAEDYFKRVQAVRAQQN